MFKTFEDQYNQIEHLKKKPMSQLQVYRMKHKNKDRLHTCMKLSNRKNQSKEEFERKRKRKRKPLMQTLIIKELESTLTSDLEYDRGKREMISAPHSKPRREVQT